MTVYRRQGWTDSRFRGNDGVAQRTMGEGATEVKTRFPCLSGVSEDSGAEGRDKIQAASRSQSYGKLI